MGGRRSKKSMSKRSMIGASVSKKQNREAQSVPEVNDDFGLVKAKPENAQIQYNAEKDELKIGKGRNAIVTRPSANVSEKPLEDALCLSSEIEKCKIRSGVFNGVQDIKQAYEEAKNHESDVKDGVIRPLVDERGKSVIFPTDNFVVRNVQKSQVHSLNFRPYYSETGLYLDESIDLDKQPENECVMIAGVYAFKDFEAFSDIKAILRYSHDGSEVNKDDYWFEMRLSNQPLAATKSRAREEFCKKVTANYLTREGSYLGRYKDQETIDAEAKRRAEARKQTEKKKFKDEKKNPPTQEELDIENDSENNIRPELVSEINGRQVLLPYPKLLYKGGVASAIWIELYWKTNASCLRPCYVDLSWHSYYFLGELHETFVLPRRQWFYQEFSCLVMNNEQQLVPSNFVIETKAGNSAVFKGTWPLLRHARKVQQHFENEQRKAEEEQVKRTRRVQFEKATQEQEDNEDLDLQNDPALEREGPSTCAAESHLRNLVREASKKIQRN